MSDSIQTAAGNRARSCLCGKLATHTCGELWPPVQLALCPEPLCALGCAVHRHAPGTMGYPDMKGTTQYGGDEPDGDGLWEWLLSKWRTIFWSPLRKAQGTYAEICANIPPPAPWPFVQLLVGTKRFECSNGTVKEVEVFNHRTPRSL